MRAVCQRVSEARVRVDDVVRGEIETGLVVLVGIARGDAPVDAERLARKIARLRIFPDDRGKFDRSVVDVGGAALVVSQFTLIADTRKGNRPSFVDAASPEEAEPLYEELCKALCREGVPVETGICGARMALERVIDGPVRFVLG
jgi:D-aminoacyl-tRNA deacylase